MLNYHLFNAITKSQDLIENLQLLHGSPLKLNGCSECLKALKTVSQGGVQWQSDVKYYIYNTSQNHIIIMLISTFPQYPGQGHSIALPLSRWVHPCHDPCPLGPFPCQIPQTRLDRRSDQNHRHLPVWHKIYKFIRQGFSTGKEQDLKAIARYCTNTQITTQSNDKSIHPLGSLQWTNKSNKNMEKFWK